MSDQMTEGKPESPIDPLDQLLREQFSRQLDPHIGRAATAFLAETTADARQPSRMRLWWVTPLLAAAAAVAIVAGPILRYFKPIDAATPAVAQRDGTAAQSPSVDLAQPADANATLASFEPKDVEGVIRWANRDEGTVWLDDDTPARKIRRQRVETLQWTDPRDSSRIEISIPHEEIVLVSSPRF